MTMTLSALATAPPVSAPRLRVVRYEPDPDEGAFARLPASGSPAQMLDPASGSSASPPPLARPPDDDGVGQRAQQVLRLALEVLDGRRPITQLAAYVDPPTLRYLRAAGRRGCGPSRLTSLRVCRPRPGAAEVAAVYRLDGRARALAARFERHDDGPGSWRCVALRLG